MDINRFSELLKEISKYKIAELKSIVDKYKKIIILGNGGSCAIASHIAEDYTKQLGKQAFTFSDPARLTCYINDYGMDKAYMMFLRQFADKKTLVILISSSGSSINILNAARECGGKGIPYMILSGFSHDNDLNQFESPVLNYWVDSNDYGIVENLHSIYLHSII